MLRGQYEIGQYAFLGVYRNLPGMSFSNLKDSGCGMLAVWAIFLVEWPLFMVLGWYFEQVISTGNGIKRHPLFFLDYFMKKKDAVVSHGSERTSAVTVKSKFEMADVQAERDRVERLTDLSGHPIVVRDVQKVFPGQDGGQPKTAVKNLTLAIERGECFGLLGPNVAGKTTSINVLTGFLEPSGGSAIIEGLDISVDMNKIYQVMGVCPQHDLIWEQLTGEEHLLFYGRLKGYNSKKLTVFGPRMCPPCRVEVDPKRTCPLCACAQRTSSRSWCPKVSSLSTCSMSPISR